MVNNFQTSYNGVDLSAYATKQELEDAADQWSAGYTPKGPATVSTINGLTGQQNGDVYTLTDGGTVNLGSLTVSAGDQIAWDSSNSIWYHINEYIFKEFQATQNTIIDENNFELGNISMSSSSLNYTNSSSRFRTKQGKNIFLKSGDSIKVKSGYVMYVAYSADGFPTYTVNGWITNFIAPYDCYLNLLVRRSTEETITFKEMQNSFYTMSVDSNIVSKSVIQSMSNYRIARPNLWVMEFTGQDSTAIVSDVMPASKNQWILVQASSSDWNRSNIAASSNVLAIRKVLSDGTRENLYSFLARDPMFQNPIAIKVPDDAVGIDLFFRADSGEKVIFNCYQISDCDNILNRKSIVKGINHRGYCEIAPENTLPAFRLSAVHGFKYVETDLRTTSDGYIVCCHDSTVDRTSNGSGAVSSMTIDQLKALDFGSWKSIEYTGTKIPTLDEFLICCRNLGIDVYLEIKDADASTVLNTLKRYSMLSHATIISDNYPNLTTFRDLDSKIRLGYIVSNITNGVISNASSLQTNNNEVFIDADYNNVESSHIELMKTNNLPLEVWTPPYLKIFELDEYISGYTCNSANASYIKYIQEIAE